MTAYGQYDIPTVEECVNFKIGQPAADMLPLGLLREASAVKFSEEDPMFLQYGNIYGFPKFRQALSGFLTKRYNHVVTVDELLATNGNTGALSLLLCLFCKSGDLVFAEEPTYFLAKRIFEDYKLKTHQVPMEIDGVNVVKLEEDLLNLQNNNQPMPVLMYVVTTAHNPTGRTLSHEKRIKLVEIAKKFNFLLVCDEVYQLLTFPSITPPPPMFTYDKDGTTVLGLGSFSKILCPAIRVGWIQGAQQLLKRIASCGQLDSSGGVNPICYGIVEKCIELGYLDVHLEEVRKKLKSRFESLRQSLDKHIVGLDGVSYEIPQGGYFVLVKLRDGDDASKLLEVSLKHKVAFLPGGGFAQNMKNYLRLSFSMYSPEDIAVGVERLCSSIKEYQENKAK